MLRKVMRITAQQGVISAQAGMAWFGTCTVRGAHVSVGEKESFLRVPRIHIYFLTSRREKGTAVTVFPPPIPVAESGRFGVGSLTVRNVQTRAEEEPLDLQGERGLRVQRCPRWAQRAAAWRRGERRVRLHWTAEPQCGGVQKWETGWRGATARSGESLDFGITPVRHIHRAKELQRTRQV